MANTSDASGNTGWSYAYEPFGKAKTTTGTGPTNPMRFAGEYLDATGLYHLRARQYDPGTGRFSQQDPAGLPSVVASAVPALDEGGAIPAAIDDPYVASYVYANNDPTRLTDPTGLCVAGLFGHHCKRSIAESVGLGAGVVGLAAAVVAAAPLEGTAAGIVTGVALGAKIVSIGAGAHEAIKDCRKDLIGKRCGLDAAGAIVEGLSSTAGRKLADAGAERLAEGGVGYGRLPQLVDAAKDTFTGGIGALIGHAKGG